MVSELTSTPVRRTRNRKGDGARLKQTLLEAAERVLVAKGPAGVTLRAVAREADVSAPSVYLHFADRDDVVWQLLRRTWQQLATAMEQAEFEAASKGPYAQLKAQLGACVDFATSEPLRYAMLFAVPPEGVQPEQVDSAVRPAHDALARAVARCREAGYTFPLAEDGSDADPSTVLIHSIAHGRLAIGQAEQVNPYDALAVTRDFISAAIDSVVRPPC